MVFGSMVKIGVPKCTFQRIGVLIGHAGLAERCSGILVRPPMCPSLELAICCPAHLICHSSRLESQGGTGDMPAPRRRVAGTRTARPASSRADAFSPASQRASFTMPSFSTKSPHRIAMMGSGRRRHRNIFVSIFRGFNVQFEDMYGGKVTFLPFGVYADGVQLLGAPPGLQVLPDQASVVPSMYITGNSSFFNGITVQPSHSMHAVQSALSKKLSAYSPSLDICVSRSRAQGCLKNAKPPLLRLLTSCTSQLRLRKPTLQGTNRLEPSAKVGTMKHT